ncbi:MAG: DUF4190 domain-containing protein [Actinomycetaceae bacterium]|nr:DUF4190 domain-containing protein [Actinomycetaceae bacterium]MDY6082950.1 DUF4190 domain-containing protein [Actinomycetaceae bacterium]
MTESPTPESASQDSPTPTVVVAAVKHSVLAIAALVAGVLAILGSWIPILNNFSVVLGIVGVVLAIVGLVAIRKGKKTGKGLAIAGLVLNILAIVIALVLQNSWSKAIDEEFSSPKVTETSQAADGTKTDGATKASDKSAEKDADKPAATTNLGVGTKATLSNGLVVSVDAVDKEVKDTIGDTYLVATVSYTNTGKEKVDYDSFDWKGVDANGAATNPEVPMFDDVKLLESGSLNANGTVTGKVPFKAGTVTIEYYGNFVFDDNAAASWKAQ